MDVSVGDCMYGVINFNDKCRMKHKLVIYSDVSSAISFFYNTVEERDIELYPYANVLPHIDQNLLLLSSQDIIYSVDIIGNFLNMSNAILNVAVVKDKNGDRSIGCVLLRLDVCNIALLSKHYDSL